MEKGDGTDGKTDERTKVDNAKPLITAVFGVIFAWMVATKSISGNWDFFTFPDNWKPRLDLKVSVLYILWNALQCVIYLLPIGGETKQGIPLRGGHRLSYRLNGFLALIMNLIGFLVAHLLGMKMGQITDKIMEIVTIAIVMNFTISLALYFKVEPKADYQVNPAANQGNILQDFLLGRTLSPQIGNLGLILVTFRSAFIAIVLIGFSIVAKSYESSQNNYTLLFTLTMVLLYVADALWFEQNLLTIREIARDGLGCTNLMIVSLMPTYYIIPMYSIASSQTEQSWYCLLSIGVLFLIGYWIYRSSNSEKFEFRQNPYAIRFKEYETIKTSQGRSLLVSGWWGMCRHPNYLGDIILNFSLCLPAGFSQIWPYSYAILLVFMLVDRERQDFEDCKNKYGEDWERYCHRVKYRIVPYVY